MENIQGFDFFRLHYDGDGKPTAEQELVDLTQHIGAAGNTDVVLIAHGFRNDENDAAGLYTKFLTTFRQHVDGGQFPGLAQRKLAVAGVFWPSKAFKEVSAGDGSAQSTGDEAHKQMALAALQDLKALVGGGQQSKLDQAAQLFDQMEHANTQDQFVRLVLSVLDGTELDATEGIDRIRATSGSQLLDKLKLPIILPTSAAPRGEGGVMSVGGAAPVGSGSNGGTLSLGSFFGSVFGRIGQFLNLTTWYLMKNRSGVVGAAGVADAVRALLPAGSSLKVHLVGHSLGGRLMAGCSKSLAQNPKIQPASLTLLEAAFSHYGFSANNGMGQVGFFRAVIDQSVVKGPLVATFSAQDTVVGTVYAIASRLAGDNVKAIGDSNDPFGGIGRNGTQKTAEATSEKLHAVNAAYQFPAGKILNLDGSGGLIKDHGDVTNAEVTYAFASAVSAT